MAKKHESGGRTGERSSAARASHAPRTISSRTGFADDRNLSAGAAGNVDREKQGTTGELLERGKERLGELRDSAVDTASEWASDARDAVSTAARRTQETIAPVAESVRENPWPAVLIGAGLAWLIVDGVRGRSSAPGRSPANPVDSDRMTRRAIDAGSGSARSVQDKVWRFVRQNPLLAGATAAGLGVAFSMTLPETERENELLGDTRDAVVDRARNLARGTVEAAQSVAEGVQQIAGGRS
jgi:ElaB/YqjD/DUF883 family membrane-anchored ribosome-binding protein